MQAGIGDRSLQRVVVLREGRYQSGMLRDGSVIVLEICERGDKAAAGEGDLVAAIGRAERRSLQRGEGCGVKVAHSGGVVREREALSL